MERDRCAAQAPIELDPEPRRNRERVRQSRACRILRGSASAWRAGESRWTGGSRGGRSIADRCSRTADGGGRELSAASSVETLSAVTKRARGHGTKNRLRAPVLQPERSELPLAHPILPRQPVRELVPVPTV